MCSWGGGPLSVQGSEAGGLPRPPCSCSVTFGPTLASHGMAHSRCEVLWPSRARGLGRGRGGPACPGPLTGWVILPQGRPAAQKRSVEWGVGVVLQAHNRHRFLCPMDPPCRQTELSWHQMSNGCEGFVGNRAKYKWKGLCDLL